MSDAPQYTLRWRGRQTGPFPLSEINRLLDDLKIGLGHEIFYENDWITLEQFFSATQKSAAPPVPRVKITPATIPLTPVAPAVPLVKPSGDVKVFVTPTPDSTNAADAPRYRLVFALLAIFTGFLGLHNFYARQWLTGLLQALLSVATWLMGFGIIASILWAMLEAVFVRKDGQGIEMV